MIGKLQNWRGEHRSKDWRHSGIGGLVSLEDLAKKPKTTPPSKQSKKKVPFLTIARQSVTLKSLQAAEKHAMDNGDSSETVSDIDLFSNIPASAGLTTTFSRDSTASRPSSPSRPQTADPERASFARRRSKTAGDVPHLSLDWAEKPLPLMLDFDHARQKSTSTLNSTRLGVLDNAAVGASIPRPKTSQSMESRPSTRGGRKRSNSNVSKGSRPTYSLTPAISPAQSRRPSLTGADIEKIAKVTLAKSNSNASHGSPTVRPRSNSRSSVYMAPPDEPPLPVVSPGRSVLDEVEGTLSATIRELEDLQGDWEQPNGFRPMRMSSLMYKMPSMPEVPKSAPAAQENFPPRSKSHDATASASATSATLAEPRSATFDASLPPTPSSSTLPKQEIPSLGRMQSIQIAYEKSKTAAHKLGVENDTLKQQLKFLRERLAEMGEVKSEKETLEVTVQEARTNFETTLAQLKLAKANEQALQNNLTNVSRRLEEANMQKVDVLEENSDLHDKISNMQKEMDQMEKEVEELRTRPSTSELVELKAEIAKAEEEKKLLSEQAEAADGRTDLPAIVADLTFKLEDVKRSMAEKDKYITELETQRTDLSSEMEQLREDRVKLTERNTLLQAQSQKTNNKRLSQLEKQIVDMEKSRHAAKAESEKHLQLLKEQLRRTATDVHKREHPASNLLEKKLNIEEAIAEVRLKAERRLAREDSAEPEDENQTQDPEARIAHLEKEIEYHVKDIVLYKLDVKGYRKDLKRAKDKIAALTEAAAAAQNEEQRPSVSSQGSTGPNAVPALSPLSPLHHGHSDTESLGPATPSLASALQVQMPVTHILSAWSPGASPRSTPGVEKKQVFPLTPATATPS